MANNIDSFTIFPQEWTLKESQGNTYYKNKVTNQEFQLFRLNPNKISNQDLRAYIERSVCPIPKTPKVIIFQDSSQQNCLNLLIQRSNIQSKTVIPNLTLKLQFFDKIRECAKVAHSLYLRYGDYYLTEDMVKFDQNAEVLLWINSNFVQNKPFMVSKSAEKNIQRAIISQIISIFQQYCNFNLREQLLIPIPISFAQFQIKLQHLIKLQKKRLTTLSMQKKDVKHSFKEVQPRAQEQKIQQNQKNLMMMKQAQHNKKEKIPRFITQMNKNIKNSHESLIQKLSRDKRMQINNKSIYQNSNQMTKTVIIKSIQNSIDQFSCQKIKESTQTLPRNKIKNLVSSPTKQPNIRSQASLQKGANKNQEYNFKADRRAQPVTLLELCHKFRISQCLNAQSDESEDFSFFSFQQKQNLCSDYYFECNPGTQNQESGQRSLEEQFFKVIG